MSGNEEKSDKSETELRANAEQLVKKAQYEEALALYETLLGSRPADVELIDLLLSTHDKITRAWTEEDFAKNMGWAMMKKELLDPAFKRIHDRLRPENKEIQKLILQLIKAKNNADETACVEQIKNYGGAAVYPLIDALLSFKTLLPAKKFPALPGDEE